MSDDDPFSGGLAPGLRAPRPQPHVPAPPPVPAKRGSVAKSTSRSVARSAAEWTVGSGYSSDSSFSIESVPTESTPDDSEAELTPRSNAPTSPRGMTGPPKGPASSAGTHMNTTRTQLHGNGVLASSAPVGPTPQGGMTSSAQAAKLVRAGIRTDYAFPADPSHFSIAPTHANNSSRDDSRSFSKHGSSRDVRQQPRQIFGSSDSPRGHPTQQAHAHALSPNHKAPRRSQLVHKGMTKQQQAMLSFLCGGNGGVTGD